MRHAIVPAALVAFAMSAQATVFSGTIDGNRVSILLPDTTGEVFTFSLHESETPLSFFLPDLDLRLLTGRRTEDRVEVVEWSAADRITAHITAEIMVPTRDGRILGPELRGKGIHLVHDSQSLQAPEALSAPVMQRLHDAVRAARWNDAMFSAKLACALDDRECGWTRALPALQAARVPAAEAYEPWKSLVLERAGRWHDALKASRELCEQWSRIGCLFHADLATRPKVNAREVYRFTCHQRQVRCDGRWGASEIALIDAAWMRDEAGVERLLRGNVNVNAGGDDLLPTALQTAAMHGSLSIVKQLVERGADVRAAPPTAWLSPLFYAIDERNEELALYLLSRGAPIHMKRDEQYGDENLLVEATGARMRRVVHAMLELGESPDWWGVPAGSALTIAVDNGDLAIARDLIAHGARPDYELKFSEGSPIDHARRTGQTQMLQLLLAARKGRS